MTRFRTLLTAFAAHFGPRALAVELVAFPLAVLLAGVALVGFAIIGEGL
jgi:hypothetical protein